MSQQEEFRCGWAALLGRPNTGKSTLLNQALGSKVSIVSRRAQTTRHRVLGILSDDDCQIVFVDTPGIHDAGSSYINRVFNRAATSSVDAVHVALMLIDARGWKKGDDKVLKLILQKGGDIPVVLLINKIDLLPNKDMLLPLMAQVAEKHDFADIIPVSALSEKSVRSLTSCLYKYLPEGEADFPKDMITDRNLRFMAAELVREQIFEQLGDELPYQSAVEVEEFEQVGELSRVAVLIWLDKDSHKPIFLGKDGARLKRISSKARKSMEDMFGNKVYLQVWVKVRTGWADSDLSLKTLGYLEE